MIPRNREAVFKGTLSTLAGRWASFNWVEWPEGCLIIRKREEHDIPLCFSMQHAV
jgi:hypothetical protein